MDITLKRSHLIASSAAILILAGGIVWLTHRPKPTPWLNYPTDGNALVTQFMNLIQQDTKESHNAAYKLTNLPDQHPDDDGHLQVYHDLVTYMTMLFGHDWNQGMKVATLDQGKLYAVQIGTETLHIDVTPQGPPGGPPTDHLGIVGIQEFSLDDSGRAVQMAAISSILGGVAGKHAQDNLSGVIAAGGSFAHMSPTQRKQVIIPVILNPNNIDSRRAMLHLYPLMLQKDQTVIAILQKISADQRFAPDVRKTADDLLDNRVDETELTAIGE